jgi:alpha-L-rhamnosidase
MGKVVLGCPIFEVVGSAGVVVDVSISEYLQDGRVLASRKITGTERTDLTDRITLRDGEQEWQRQDYNGYRFLQLTIRNARQPLIIRKVGTIMRAYRFAHEATFTSSNPSLDSLFNMSKWSHKVAVHWGYCAAASREHAQWVDPAWSASNEVVFNDRPVMSYYLHQIMLGQNDEGAMGFPYPGSMPGELPEQTMWLARMLWDSGLYFDDIQMMRDLLPSLVKANEWFKKHLAPDGLLTTAGDWKIWLVIDWGYPFCNNLKPGELATLNMIYYEYLRSTERVAGAVGNRQVEETFRRQADNLKETINRVYFSPEDARYYEEPSHGAASQFASALAVEYGVVPPGYERSVLDVAVGGDLRPAKASPWFMYEVLETFAAAGRYVDAVSAIRRYWETFLQGGATTFWELWNIPGEDVHPLPGYTREMFAQTITYASGPAPYVVNHILGVEPLNLGYGEALIAPHYSGLQFAEGNAPTPKGDVHVGWQENDEDNWTDLFIAVPEGLKATVRLPYSKGQPYVRINNRLFFDGTRFSSDPLITNPENREEFLEFQIAPGNYFFRSSGAR